jgi:formiminotetrahydrofolate cyclodeaminase
MPDIPEPSNLPLEVGQKLMLSDMNSSCTTTSARISRMQQSIFPITLQQMPLLELPAQELLARFGSGGHKPGSGSAAALVGVLSCKLILTVISLTKNRPEYKYQQIVSILNNMEILIKNTIEPRLIELFEEDSRVFDLVIAARRKRDRNKNNYIIKNKAQNEEIDQIKPATEIPIEIAKLCLDLAKSAFFIFEHGFSSARGDSGVAISMAISGAVGAINIAYLNLIKMKKSTRKWVKQSRKECEKVLLEATRLQEELFVCVVKLAKEGNTEQINDQSSLF